MNDIFKSDQWWVGNNFKLKLKSCTFNPMNIPECTPVPIQNMITDAGCAKSDQASSGQIVGGKTLLTSHSQSWDCQAKMACDC